jgi:hypothetical protein
MFATRAVDEIRRLTEKFKAGYVGDESVSPGVDSGLEVPVQCAFDPKSPSPN